MQVVRRRALFDTARAEGALLPQDLLLRVARLDPGLKGLAPADYHLAAGERLQDVINHSWNRLRGAWRSFRAALDARPAEDAATGLTREKWLSVLFHELGFGRLARAPALEIAGKGYPISHLWQGVPIHLLGFRVDLDRRTRGVEGAARASPHGLVQEYLNRSDGCLWGLVSNGRRLRVLRDNVSLTRQAFLEFDLESMLDGEVYPDFRLLWLVCHQSRLEGETPADCWLERWSKTAQQEGTRVLDRLRDGVERAIERLGQGFLAAPGSAALAARLRSGALSTQDFYRQLLRLAYRLIFLFVAEDRELLLDPRAPEAAKDRYRRFYGSERIRRLAARRRGSRHVDLWRGLSLVMDHLHAGSAELALPALGSFLWSRQAIPDLAGLDLGNDALLDAIHHLCWVVDGGASRPVDFQNLGPEELGGIYESLLELHPEVDAAAASFALKAAAGHERKTTGSYYTPESLVQCLLDTALDPVLDDAARQKDPEAAILSLKVLDPACGSGHFLIAAAHRMAKRLAAARTGDDEPAPDQLRQALRDVAGRCLFGVDKNPMAVELCKVSLWLEALEPGRPLSFLDHHVQQGDSLLGATPALLRGGIPDAAFEPIEGDDKAVARSLKKQNKDERKGQKTLFTALAAEPPADYLTLRDRVAEVDALADSDLGAVREKETLYSRLRGSAEYRKARLLADAWCAAFVWQKARGAPPPVTEQVFREIERRGEAALGQATLAEVERLRERCGFFHWHVAFPDVFEVDALGWKGGFDCVLGNPPWERVKLQEKEFFAARAPEIAAAPNAAARRKQIDALAGDDATRRLHDEFLEARREAEGASRLVRDTGRYPLCGRGDVNTYAVFAETMRDLLSPAGRVGCIVPSGIATDDTTKFFFQSVMESRSLASLYDFENSVGLFPGVGHGRAKFCLLTMRGSAGDSETSAEFAFYLKYPRDLLDPERHFTLSSADIALVNPNTRTCPVFRSRRDAEITRSIYARVPVLLREGDPEGNPWGLSFATMFHMSNDSALFRTRSDLEQHGCVLVGNVFQKDGERFLPLYEAKMIHHFDHRWGDYALRPQGSQDTQLPDIPAESLADPSYAVFPRYWVPESEVESRLQGKWSRGWLLGWRDICRSTDERTVIAGVFPRVGVGNNLPVSLLQDVGSEHAACLVACISSLVFDFAARFKVGGTHLNFFIAHQLPVLAPRSYSAPAPWSPAQPLRDWLFPRVLELTYTALDLAPFARDLGYAGPPFRWDEERRFLLRCELDAAFFHLYGIDQADASYILDTFPIVRRKDEKLHGFFRTKDLILDLHSRLAAAIRTGQPYHSLLDPPPADPRAAHRPREQGKPA